MGSHDERKIGSSNAPSLTPPRHAGRAPRPLFARGELKLPPTGRWWGRNRNAAAEGGARQEERGEGSAGRPAPVGNSQARRAPAVLKAIGGDREEPDRPTFIPPRRHRRALVSSSTIPLVVALAIRTDSACRCSPQGPLHGRFSPSAPVVPVSCDGYPARVAASSVRTRRARLPLGDLSNQKGFGLLRKKLVLMGVLPSPPEAPAPRFHDLVELCVIGAPQHHTEGEVQQIDDATVRPVACSRWLCLLRRFGRQGQGQGFGSGPRVLGGLRDQRIVCRARQPALAADATPPPCARRQLPWPACGSEA